MKECPVCRRCFPDEVNHCPQDGDATTLSLMGEPTLDGRYLLERRLGQGGMGVVFQARHIFLKTPHAIKVILPDLVGNDPMLATRFRQEALAAAAIRHQNVIAVTDFGMVRGTMPFLVMEFVKGKSLQDILSGDGAMQPERASELISAVASGVGAAHRQNIVHRDLKPLNIMVQDDIPVAEGLKILDFGLAKIKSGELLGSFIQAQTSGLMGSPFYMAPEQWSDEEPDARADIYSLGIILYQMLSGEVPFKGTSIPSIMKKHLTLPPPSFQSKGVSVSPQLEAVVRHSLEKEVGDRIVSVEAFLKELRAAIDSSPIVVIPGRVTGELDRNKTIVSEQSAIPIITSPGFTSTAEHLPSTGDTNFGESFDSLAGTVSGSALDEELQEQLTNTAAKLRREKEEQEELAAAETQRLSEKAEKRRVEQDEQAVREKAEREVREREQQEKYDRMAQQARELEERLARLSVSIPPKTQMDDSATHVIDRGATSLPMQSIGDESTVVREVAPPRRGIPIFLIVAVVVILGLVSVGTAAYFIFRNRTSPIVTQPGHEEGPPIKSVMVEIEGGMFQMGRNNGPPQERPSHPVQVQSFFIDKTEVTNAEYAVFVQETNHTPPSHWGGTKPPADQVRWPAVNVSQADAIEFAAWRSKRDGVEYRLPTEEEWEYAARNGTESDLFPWGPDWEPGNAVVKEATAAPVGSRPNGKNKWGVEDLIGNVWEWTSSKVSVYPGNERVIPPETRNLVTIRGACYVSDPSKSDTPITSAVREFLRADTMTPLLGFRLVRSVS